MDRISSATIRDGARDKAPTNRVVIASMAILTNIEIECSQQDTRLATNHSLIVVNQGCHFIMEEISMSTKRPMTK